MSEAPEDRYDRIIAEGLLIPPSDPRSWTAEDILPAAAPGSWRHRPLLPADPDAPTLSEILQEMRADER